MRKKKGNIIKVVISSAMYILCSYTIVNVNLLGSMFRVKSLGNGGRDKLGYRNKRKSCLWATDVKMYIQKIKIRNWDISMDVEGRRREENAIFL
jgi:hypothetical protein